jgi:hypothetical protein
MSGIRYTISGLMLFFIYKIYSLEIFDNKKRKQKTENIQTSIKHQQQKKEQESKSITINKSKKTMERCNNNWNYSDSCWTRIISIW